RYLRFPLYVLYANSGWYSNAPEFHRKPMSALEPAEQVMARKTKFCGFVIGNVHRKTTQKRVEFFHRLSRYKKVDSDERALNNIDGAIPDRPNGKYNFLLPYKFNICFENKSIPNYTTEKIYETILTHYIPIY